jgi:hypothetical protein
MPIPSLKDELLLYLKKLKKRNANQEMRNASPNDGFRVEGLNITYRKIVLELEDLLSGKGTLAP